MNRLFHHAKGILSHLVKNDYFANFPKVLVGGFFDNFSNHSINCSISIGTKRSLYTSSNAFSKFYNKRSISTNGPFNNHFLKLPTNRKEEVKFLEDFRLANKFAKIRALIAFKRAAKSRNHSFSVPFCGEICDSFSEWISTQKRMPVLDTLYVLHVHQYLNMSVNSDFNRKIGKWIQSGELSKMTYDEYFSFVSALSYMPSLKFNKEQLEILAAEGKQYIKIPESTNYYLVTFIWCWTNMNDSLKLSQLCPEVFQLWFNVTLPRIPQLTEKECSQCIVALGKEGQLPPLEWREEMTKKLLTFKTFDEQQCSNVTMSIAKLPDLIPNDSDRKTLLKKLSRIYTEHVLKNGQTHPQPLANICWAQAKLYKSNIIDFKPPSSYWDTAFNAKFVGKFCEEAALQMIDSMLEFGIDPPNNFLEELFHDFKATKPSVAGLILYGLYKRNYICKIPERVIRDCFKTWYDGIAYLPFEQLTFPRYALCEMYPDFKLKPTDIIPEFGPHFWKEIERRLDQNEVERAKNIYYLIKAHLVFNDIPIDLLNRLLMLTKVNDESAEGAAKILWLYGRLSEYKEVEIPNDLLRHNFDVWFTGLDSLKEGHAVFGLWGLHCHNINPETINPNFSWSLYYKKIEKKSFNLQGRNMLRSSIQKFANEIPEDLVTKFMNK